MSAYLRLIDNSNNIYNFPPDFWLKDLDWKTTQSIKNIAFAAGGRDISDGYLEARPILIEGALRADTLAELETKLRAFQRAVLVGGKLYVTDDTVSRYLTVKNPIVKEQYSGDYRHEIPLTISYVCEYPFWEDATETESVNVLTGIGSFNVNNSGSDFLLNPIIEIAADQGVDLPSVKLTNTSDGGMSFEYNDPNFMAGDTVEINCKEGTVKRNSNSTIEYFSPAKFLRLQNVINTFNYEGNACTITIKFRKVYL